MLASSFLREVRRRGPVKAVGIAANWLWTNYRSRDPSIIRKAGEANGFFFDKLGIERASAEKEYRRAAALVGFEPGENDSIHRLGFAALKVSGFRPARILELGTSHGETTAYLSAIFPDAQIHTVELDQDDPIYRRMHPNPEKRDANVERRLANPKITALRTNTVFLQDLDLPNFDLIWLDAGHHFPEVAWDHFFCMHRLNAGGWLFTDDVMLPDNSLARKRPGILDVWKVVNYFNERGRPFDLLLKRESPRQYVMNVKYVGFHHAPGSEQSRS